MSKKMPKRCRQRRGSYFSLTVYLGNYVINGCRRVGEERAAYGSLADALYLREAARTYAREDIEPNEIADVRDRVADAAERFLCAFEASLA